MIKPVTIGQSQRRRRRPGCSICTPLGEGSDLVNASSVEFSISISRLRATSICKGLSVLLRACILESQYRAARPIQSNRMLHCLETDRDARKGFFENESETSRDFLRNGGAVAGPRRHLGTLGAAQMTATAVHKGSCCSCIVTDRYSNQYLMLLSALADVRRRRMWKILVLTMPQTP